MQVTLTQPVAVDEVDAEIVVVEGCALGFVAPGQPPHVLHVDPGQPLKCGVQSDDLLLSIDGQQTAELSQERRFEVDSQALGAFFKVFSSHLRHFKWRFSGLRRRWLSSCAPPRC